MANFADSVSIVLKHEGGYAFNPADPGGETNYGISKAQYPDLNIAGLTRQDAVDIYFRDYWTRFRINEVKSQNIANAVLDAVVHHGQGASIVQKALNRAGMDIKVDNIIGSQTVNALNSVSEGEFLSAYVRERKDYMDSLIDRNPALGQFKTAWHKRVDFFLTGAKGGFKTSIVLIAAGIAAYFLLSKKKKVA